MDPGSRFKKGAGRVRLRALGLCLLAVISWDLTAAGSATGQQWLDARLRVSVEGMLVPDVRAQYQAALSTMLCSGWSARKRRALSTSTW